MSSLLHLVGIYDCCQVIFTSLDRTSLKNLRLACKTLDESVTSLSPLFHRVYISGYEPDLTVLESIARHAHLASRVRELVWDASASPDLYKGGHFKTRAAWQAADMLVIRYRGTTHSGEDIRILIDTLPRFPRLQSATVVELMSDWMALDHRTPQPTRSDGYMSPAMRQFAQFKGKPICDPWRQPYSDWTPTESELAELQRWAGCVAQGIKVQKPVELFKLLQNATYRAPLLLSIALQSHSINLKSYRTLGPTQCLPPDCHPVARHCFNGHRTSHFLPSRPVSIIMRNLFTHLRHLSLWLHLSPKPTGSELPHVLRHASNLESLHLGLIPPAIVDLRWICPDTLSRLRHLTLQQVGIRGADFETFFMPWCFRTGLQSLTLVNCVLVLERGMSAVDLYKIFLSRDVHVRDQNNHQNQIHDPTPDMSDIDIEMEDILTDSEPIPFVDQHLDSDDSDDSDDFGYYTDDNSAVVSLFPPHADSDTDEFEYEFYEPSDTVNDLDEPMRALSAAEARRITCPWYESVELLYCGETWGCGPGLLRVLVDGFDFVGGDSG
ncbi:hypothetical protein BJX61DRAFT_540137 [Aspergillus egyptiacus]|nr:hypothetical protein BJX61DRAFT_540137 [Aspergillus egyptiacus]